MSCTSFWCYSCTEKQTIIRLLLILFFTFSFKITHAVPHFSDLSHSTSGECRHCCVLLMSLLRYNFYTIKLSHCKCKNQFLNKCIGLCLCHHDPVLGHFFTPLESSLQPICSQFLAPSSAPGTPGPVFLQW